VEPVERARQWPQAGTGQAGTASRRRAALGPLVLAAAVLAGGVLRLRGLGDWALNPDEGIYRAVAAAPDLAAFARGLAETAHPPVYFLLLRVWAAIGVAGDPAWLRLPAALFGTAGIAALFGLTRRAFGPATACVAATGWALAPGAVALAQLVRPYALLFVLLATGWWALLGFLERGARRERIAYGAAFALALATHYSAAIPLAATIAWLLLAGALGGHTRPGATVRTHARSLAALHALLLGEGIGLLLLHLRGDAATAGPPASMAWLSPFLPSTPGDLWLAFVGLHRFVFGPGPDGLATLLGVLGLGASLVAARGGSRVFAGLVGIALAIGGALALLGLHPFGGTRHAAWAFVGIVPLAAEGARRLLAGPLPLRVAGALALVAAIAVPVIPDAISGASRLRFGAQVERLATPDQLAAFPLAGLRARPLRLLLDEQAFYFLQPFFADAVLRGNIDEDARVYELGATRLVVARCWVLRAGRERPDAPDHALGLARRASEALGAPPDGAWLVSGGWAPLAAKGLVGRGLAEPMFDRPWGAIARLRPSSTVSVR
jgi:hypothetical protein